METQRPNKEKQENEVKILSFYMYEQDRDDYVMKRDVGMSNNFKIWCLSEERRLLWGLRDDPSDKENWKIEKILVYREDFGSGGVMRIF